VRNRSAVDIDFKRLAAVLPAELDGEIAGSIGFRFSEQSRSLGAKLVVVEDRKRVFWTGDGRGGYVF
jgi:hypothetical protein